MNKVWVCQCCGKVVGVNPFTDVVFMRECSFCGVYDKWSEIYVREKRSSYTKSLLLGLNWPKGVPMEIVEIYDLRYETC